MIVILVLKTSSCCHIYTEYRCILDKETRIDYPLKLVLTSEVSIQCEHWCTAMD
jgi:hypothetical protein